jgi:hypothetical protein
MDIGQPLSAGSLVLPDTRQQVREIGDRQGINLRRRHRAVMGQVE